MFEFNNYHIFKTISAGHQVNRHFIINQCLRQYCKKYVIKNNYNWIQIKYLMKILKIRSLLLFILDDFSQYSAPYDK